MSDTKTYPVKINDDLTVTLTAEDIDDILCSSLEGGITSMWCYRVEPLNDFTDGYANEQITRGNKLLFHLIDEDEIYDAWDRIRYLDIKTFLKGFAQWYRDDPEHMKDDFVLDIGQIDAIQADMIVQYALFGEYVYG